MLTVDDLQKIKTIVYDVVETSVNNSETRIKTELRAEMRNNFVSRKEFTSEIKKIWEELKYLRKSINLMLEYLEPQVYAIKKQLNMA